MIAHAEFELNCQYSKAGCLVEGLGRKDLDEHKGDCSFRTVPCLMLDCDDKFCLRMLDNHLSQQHKFGQVLKRKDGWNFVTTGSTEGEDWYLKSCFMCKGLPV